jgi:hypothetical protein
MKQVKKQKSRNYRFTSVFTSLEPNPQFKGSLTFIANKVINRGQTISEMKK